MSDAAIFGPSFDPSDLERALIAHLEVWMPDYVEWQRRKKDPDEERWTADTLEGIRDYRVTHLAGEKWPENQIPCLIVKSPGEEGEPNVQGDGTVTAQFGAVVFAIAEGVDEEDSKELARLYGTAARLAIIQHPSIGGLAASTYLGPAENTPLTRGVEADRSLAVFSCQFAFQVEGVANIKSGPDKPSEDPTIPPEDRPTIKTTGMDVRPGKKAVEELTDKGHFTD